MSEKLVIPEPKGTEHDKWKAMVDSVIEFITASRTMLQVLHERIKDNEKMRDERMKQMEEEKVKMEFYQGFMNSEQEAETTMNLSAGKQDSGDKIYEENKDEKPLVTNRIQRNNSALTREGKKFTSRIPRTKSCLDERNKCKELFLES